jgi:hypothetical protein
MAPVDARLLADSATRAEWQRKKGMKVFSLWDSTAARPTVDFLLECPVPFEDMWQGARTVDFAGLVVRIASREHLIRMKSSAGRPRDLQDVTALKALDFAPDREP